MQKKTKKRLWIGLVVILVLVGAGAWGMMWMMKQPLYRFGDVRAKKNLSGPLLPPKQTDPKSWWVEKGIRLHFTKQGQGRPALVVHGGPGIPYASPWKGLEALKKQYTFYYYHQRGCGLSSRPFQRFSGGNFYNNMRKLEKTLGLGAQIADIERIRQILGQKKLILIGHSYGGFIAALYAAEFPQHVEKLILVAPAGVLTPPDKERNLFSRARAKLPKERHTAFDKVMADYFDFGKIFSKSDDELAALHTQLGEFLLPAMGYKSSNIKKGFKSGGWMVFAMYFSVGRAQDYRAAMRQIAAPTLILHGKDDGISLPGSRSYEALIPKVQLTMLSKEDARAQAGHFVYNEVPKSFAKSVRAFLLKK